MPNTSPITSSTIVNVAVAVIHYQQQYLLGFRHAAQYQGNRYEFVGGKIDADESPITALIREVAEETGIDISSINDSSGHGDRSEHQSNNNNDSLATTAIKLGRLHHDYGDKQVCLQVYNVTLTAAQYQQHQDCAVGLEGQALIWVPKDKLLAGVYPLPAANQTILQWLKLPTQVAITHPVAHFEKQANFEQNHLEQNNLERDSIEQDNMTAQAAWLNYHQQHLPAAAWVYMRPKGSDSAAGAALVSQLMQARSDIQTLVPMSLFVSPLFSHSSANIKALHLTHTDVMTWFESISLSNKKSIDPKAIEHTTNDSHDHLLSANYPSASHPLIISCHDSLSINAANQLAARRVQQQLPPVIGIFLSPVMSTQTHPDAEPLGWASWSSLAQLADMPVLALGGLSPAMSAIAAQHGATSIAGIRQFHDE